MIIPKNKLFLTIYLKWFRDSLTFKKFPLLKYQDPKEKFSRESLYKFVRVFFKKSNETEELIL